MSSPHFPFFHPKDDKQLVALFELDTKNFQYYDASKAKWIEGTPVSNPRKIQGVPEPLVYRFHGVIDAPELPQVSIPHNLPPAVGLRGARTAPGHVHQP